MGNTIHIRERVTDPDQATASLAAHASGEGKEAQRCLKQARRVAQITDRLKHRATNFPTDKNHIGLRPRTARDSNNLQRIYCAMNRDSVNKLLGNINRTNADEHDLATYLTQRDYNDTIAIATLTKHTHTHTPLPRARPHCFQASDTIQNSNYPTVLCRHHHRPHSH